MQQTHQNNQKRGGAVPLLSLPLHSWHCAWMAHPQPHLLQQQQRREVRLWVPLSVRGAQPHPLQQQQRREVRLWARPQPHPLPGDYDSNGTGDYDDVR